MSTSNEIKNRITELQFYPSNIQDAVLTLLEEAGTIIPDPTNPFTFCLETAVTAASVLADSNEVIARKVSPILAESFEDLYRHMSVNDHLDRFATPAIGTALVLMLDDNEVRTLSVEDPLSGAKKLVIPGDTVYTVGGINLYGHYPIIITALSNGQYQVVYDLSVPSSIKEATTNSLDWTIGYINGRKILQIKVPVDQLTHTVTDHTLSNAVGFSVNVPYPDSYYYAIVKHSTDGVSWSNAKTTHSSMTFDQNMVTATLAVSQGMLKVTIPEIYITKGMVGSNIRIQIYSTKGTVNEPIADLATSAFTVAFTDYDKRLAKYTSPLGRFGFAEVYAESDLSGGSDGLTFEELKKRVLYGALDKDVPINFPELEQQLAASGFGISVIKENILGSLYLVTKRLTNNSITGIGTIGSAIGILNFDSTRTDLPTSLVSNGKRSTLKPTALYERTNSTFKVLADSERSRLENLGTDLLIDELNTRELFYQPFFFLLDSTEGTFRVRTYDLENTAVLSRSFIDNSPTLGFSVNTKDMTVELRSYGYQITVSAEVPEGMEGLYLQAVFTSPISGERWFASVATPTTDNRTATFTFDIETTFDINIDNEIEVTNLLDSSGGPSSAFLPLDTTLDFIYVAESSSDIATTFDSKFSRALHENFVVGITYENAVIRLGRQLKRYYVTGRSVIKPPVYQKYNADVPKVYSTDVYLRDEAGTVFELDVNGRPAPVVLHSAGDQVLNADLEPEYLHRAGDYVLDSLGSPIAINAGDIIRELTIPVYDAKYLFGTTPDIISFRETLGEVVSGYVLGDIEGFAQRRHERTELPFAPTNTDTNATVTLGDGSTTKISTSLSFSFNLTTYKNTYTRTNIRTVMESVIRDAVREMVESRRINVSSLYSNIDKLAAERLNSGDLLGIEIDVVVPTGYAKLVNGFDAFNVASRAVQLANGTVDIMDDIDIVWSTLKDEVID